MPNTSTVVIGDHVLPVVAQRHARLRHHLNGDDFAKLMSADYSTEAYRILSVLIPALPDAIPEYEWEGFSTPGDWEDYKAGNRDAYQEELDKSPTPDEVVAAFEEALKVNGAGRLGNVMSLVRMGARLAEQTPVPTTVSSPVSPGGNGVSD
jgi:hypothetical protein